MRLLGLGLVLTMCNCSYATLDGMLTAPAHDARAVVVWKTLDGVELDGDTALDDTSFALSLTKIPTLHAAPCGGEATAGTLLAYEDSDGNGRFSIATPDQPSGDRVLGAAIGEYLLYSRGLSASVPTVVGDGFHRVVLGGFGVVYLDDDAPLTVSIGATSVDQSPCEALRALDASASLYALECAH